ncbi:MAG TPA: hypothetical protein VK694_07565 [Verrucomicrobiae bacterium]|nr:hypothetical protein [Verrucomicrobiae bacterium]
MSTPGQPESRTETLDLDTFVDTFQTVLEEVLAQEETSGYSAELEKVAALQTVEDRVFRATDDRFKDTADAQLLALLEKNMPQERVRADFYLGVMVALVAIERSLK